jgi:hypothetical protein
VIPDEPSPMERALVARALCEQGVLIGTADDIWTHPSAYRALFTWRLCVDAISLLIGGGHGVQASFVKACVMQMDEVGGTVPFALDEIADFMMTDGVARLYWTCFVSDDDWPHRCPHCGAAAFVGYLLVDCRARCERSKPRG